MPFGKIQGGCHVAFTEEWVLSGHCTIKSWLVECCRDGCPSGSFTHLHKGTLELYRSDHRVLGQLPDQVPSPLIAQFGLAASSRKSLGGSKLLPFKKDGGHCGLGGPSMLQTFFLEAKLSQICASTQSCLSALQTIPSTSWFGFWSDMRCQLWDLT